MSDANDATPTVALFSLGGTIAMKQSPSGGAVPSLSATDLVASVPGLAESGIDLAVHDVRQVPGASLTLDDVIGVASAVQRSLDEGAAGAVVTQGTDTIEETSYLLDLLCTGPAPVIVTGAMRNPSMIGRDGPANLLAGVQVAADPKARGLGCVVVFGDEIHAARYVHKGHSTSPATFVSPNSGPLGYVTEGYPHIFATPPPQVRIPIAALDNVPSARVGLVTMSLGDDGEVLRAMVGRVDGLVIAGFGAGHIPAAVVPTLADIAHRIPIVLSSRTGAGRVLRHTYGFPGSEKDLLEQGLVSARYLDPFKARLLLFTLLRSGADAATIAGTFAQAAGEAPAGATTP